MVSEENQAIEAYHAVLADAGIAASTQSALSEAHDTHRLEVGGRRLCTVLRPRFLSGQRARRLADISSALAGLFERAGTALLASDRLLDLAGASETERDIWAVEPGYPGFTLTSRLDSFMTDDSPRFVEYNAESPAGIGFCDRLVEVFNNLPAVHHWRGADHTEPADARKHLLDTLLWAYRAWGGTDTPSIAVIDWDDVITKRDFELCAEYFRSHGVTTAICDPRHLTYAQGAVWYGNDRITLVYRRVLLHEFLDRAEQAEPLLRAYRDGAVCMVNSPRSKLLHKKSVLALLSDGRLIDMTAAERHLVDTTVPWTRLVESGSATYRGASTDLARLLLTHQDRFTIKPIDDYGGRGVILGWEAAEAEWRRTVEDAFGGGYVVQERVDVPREEYPVWRVDGVTYIPLWLDTDPLLFRGSMGAVLTRLSGSALLNVSAGTGSAAPTFMLDGKGR